MADKTKFHVVRGDNNFVESMTKEEILTAITQAVEQGEIHDVDTGFITTVKEQNRNNALKFWLGTQAEYNAIEIKDPLTFYIISDAEENDRIARLERMVIELATYVFYKTNEDPNASELFVNGFVTSGGTILRFTVPKTKKFYTGYEFGSNFYSAYIDNISFYLKARQNGQYVIGSSSTSLYVSPNADVMAKFTVTDEGINIELDLSKDYGGHVSQNIMNNAEIALTLSNFEIDISG